MAMACRHGAERTLVFLLKMLGNVIPRDLWKTCFRKAISGGHDEVFQLLMNKAPDVLSKTDYCEALLKASYVGSEGVIDVLASKVQLIPNSQAVMDEAL